MKQIPGFPDYKFDEQEGEVYSNRRMGLRKLKKYCYTTEKGVYVEKVTLCGVNGKKNITISAIKKLCNKKF